MVRITQVSLTDKILLIGPPGIGKTEILIQKAREEAFKQGKIFVDLREADDNTISNIMSNPEKYYVFYRIIASHVFPEDLGIPREKGQYIEFLPPKILRVLSIPNIHGLLFVDEILNLQRDDQIAMWYSLIQEKEAGWALRLSKNIKIVLAGNPPEWSEITRPLPKPLLNRVFIINVDPPTVDEWLRYMDTSYGDNYERLCGAYLKLYPEDLLRAPSDEFSGFPTPRSWTNMCIELRRLKDENAPSEFVEELVIGSVGREVGQKFLALLRTNVDVNKVINDLKVKPEVFDELSINAKILVLYAIAQSTIDSIKNLRKFVEYLAMRNKDLLIMLLIMMTRHKRIEAMTVFKDLLMPIVDDIAKYVV